MSFLVTGGLGGLGSAIVHYLAEKTTSTLVILDNLSSPSFDPRDLKSSVFFYRGDVCNEILVSHLLEKHKINTTIDCSTRRKPNNAVEAANILKSFTTLLDSIRSSQHLKHFVLTSRPQQTSEEEPLCPGDFGLASLMGAEAMLHSYVISYRLPLVIARVGYIPITGQLPNDEGLDPINVISAVDAAEGVLKTVSAKSASVFNIVGPNDWNPASKSFVASRYSSSKATEELGFVPSIIDFVVCDGRTQVDLEKILLYGQGLGCEQLKKTLETRGLEVEIAKMWPGRNCDKEVSDELTLVAPSHVVYFYNSLFEEIEGTQCEKLKSSTYELLFPPWQLASLCEKRGIHYTFIGTDDIFSDEEKTSLISEGASDNHLKSNQYTKAFAEKLLSHFPSTLKFRMDTSTSTESSYQKITQLILSIASGLYNVKEKGDLSHLDGSKSDKIVI